MNVGIFLHFDYALNGMLFNENRCYNEIFKHPNIDKIYIFDYKGKYLTKIGVDFDFEYTRVLINNIEDVEKFKKVDVLFTWDWYQDFFAGTISPKSVEIYKIISTFTNEFNRKVYFRICDSKHFMKDYKQMIQDRLSDNEAGRKFAERNKDHVKSLDDVPRLNFENVYFLCNGSRTVCDWSHTTLTHSIPFLSHEYVKDHSDYLSDDILFRYSECYENLTNLDVSNERIDKLYHVGNLNSGKTKQIKSIMKTSEVKLYLRTPKRSINNALRTISSIELIEEPIYRDEMYTEMNKYFAYLFVGKGDLHSSYFNKTLYDASIGRTVFLIYSKIDSTNIYHEFEQYKFSDSKELKEKIEWLKTENYENHLNYQREILLKNLSTDVIRVF